MNGVSVRQVLPMVLSLCVFFGGCATQLSGPATWQSVAADKLQYTQSLKEQEDQAADKTVLEYQKILQETKVEHPYPYYQERLQETISRLQSSPADEKLGGDTELGVPSIYAQRLQTVVGAHHGLARINKIRGSYEAALAEVGESVTLINDFGTILPNWTAKSLLDSYRIKQAVCLGKGLAGQALVAQLNADMLEDHLVSEGGRADGEAEETFLSGEGSQNQIKQLEAFIEQVNAYRKQQDNQKFNSMMSGLLQVNSMVQSLNATKALSQSGGVLTPQVQLAQMNAQLAQVQAVMFTTLVTGNTEWAPKFSASGSQWAVPSFGQQMVDPRQGVNARGIVKSFATLAAERSGNPSLNASAGTIHRAIDALPVIQNGQVTTDVAKRITEFAGLLNPFIEQVLQVGSQN